MSSMNSTRTYGIHGGGGREGEGTERNVRPPGVGSRPGFRGRVGAGPEILKKRTEAGWQAGLGKEKS